MIRNIFAPPGRSLVMCWAHFPLGIQSMLSLLCPLPVDAAQMTAWFPIVYTLHLKTLVADPYVQLFPFVGAVLHQSPLFTPDKDVLSLVMLAVFFGAKTIWANSSGRHDDVHMGIASRWVARILSLVDCGYCTETVLQKTAFYKVTDDSYLFIEREFIGEGANKLPPGASVSTKLCGFDLITKLLQIVKLAGCPIGLKNRAVEDIVPIPVVAFLSIAVV